MLNDVVEILRKIMILKKLEELSPEIKVEYIKEEGIYLATNSSYPSLCVRGQTEKIARELMAGMIKDMDEKLDMRVL